jgi:uncharacterized membrane protein
VRTPASPPAARHRRSPVESSHHGHGHGPAAPADRRVHAVLAALLVPCALLTVIGVAWLFPLDLPRTDGALASPRVDGHVTATAVRPCAERDDVGCLVITVQLADGPLAGRTVDVLVSAAQGARFGAGEDVVLSAAGGDPADPATYQIVDVQRDTPLIALALVFAVAVVALGRWRGVTAMAGLGVTAAALIGFVLPAILAGRDPLAVAVVGSSAVAFGAVYLTHGFSARTSTAVLGTLASLLLIAALGVTFTGAAQLTGVGDDTIGLAATLGREVDGPGLVMAGLVIGALGALDDVTITQTTAVWELRAADPALRPTALFRSAMRIGRDHVASTVNTLVLAYAGAALPLLLLFSVAERGLVDTLTTEVIATEVVRTLVGTLGLVAAVPLTTALAVVVATRGRLSDVGLSPLPRLRRGSTRPRADAPSGVDQRGHTAAVRDGDGDAARDQRSHRRLVRRVALPEHDGLVEPAASKAVDADSGTNDR